MAQRKSFPLRIDPALYAILEQWAADDLRSVNAQIEKLLWEAAKKAGRLPRPRDHRREEPDSPDEEGT